MTKPASVLAETIERLTARRAVAATELAILDEAISALQRVRTSEMLPPGAAPASPAPDLRHHNSPRAPLPAVAAPDPVPPRPTVCALASCGKRLPPPARVGGRPRHYCGRPCAQKAYKLQASAAAALACDEDPTDRALRLHRELGNTAESGTGYRGRKGGRP